MGNGKEAECIGCGCSDGRACVDDYGVPCHWIRLDRDAGTGVCSHCEEMAETWDRETKVRKAG
ncbi:MAG: hypothetical protein ACNS63_04240 [Candidatus Nitrospinota bacterium M3_3B_026]